MLGDHRLNQNPYDSPIASGVAAPPGRSRRPYWIASAVVLLCYFVSIFLLFWFSEPTIDGGEIRFHIPGESVSYSPSGDPIIAYDRMVYTTIIGAITLAGILIALSLAVVNGLILVWRRRGRPT